VAAIAPVLAGLVIGAAFVRRQRRLPKPMIDLGLFAQRAFSGALTANTLSFAVIFGLEVFVAQYSQLVLGYSPLEAGLLGLPPALAFVAGGQITAPLAARLSPRTLMVGGILVGLVGIAMLTQVAQAGVWLLVASFVVISLGLTPVFTLAADIAVGSAPPERAGAASGISETSSELGGALGLAILGTVGTAVYRDNAQDSIPAEVPAEAAAVAGDTLGGAVEVAGGLPAALAADVLEPARAAFTQGLEVAVTLSGVLLVAAAILVARLLRGGEPDESEAAPVPVPVAAAQEGCA
jgi:MFS transporter, DHA2 family, multidrug resistance protein